MVSNLLTKPATVGALACQRNSFMFNGFKTTVISCEPNKGKQNDSTKFLVELQDTIFFPEGGGQPSDTGFLIYSNDSIPVSYVSRVGLHAKHHVGQYIEPGTTVEAEIDQRKRIDYMQQHTGQHLLSAILESEPYELGTLSWSMGGTLSSKKPTLEINDYFYIELPRKLTTQEIEELSYKLNNLTSVNPLQIYVVERRADTHGNGKTSKIPVDYDLEKGILRTVHIGSMDSNPCCGTHLQNTGQIGSILLSPNQTNVRRLNSRLYFMCGNRVVNYGMAVNRLIGSTKNVLSCSESEIPEKVERQRDLIQKSSKREQFWIKELASYESNILLNNVKENGKTFLLRDEYGVLELLPQVFKEFTNKLGDATDEYLLVLCGREKSSETGSVLVVSESGDKISSIASSLSSVVPTLRGGGSKKGGKWQGKIVKFTEGYWNSVKRYLETKF